MTSDAVVVKEKCNENEKIFIVKKGTIKINNCIKTSTRPEVNRFTKLSPTLT